MTASVSKEQLVVNQASSTPSIPPSAGQAEVDKIAKTTASATPVATGGSRGNTNSPAAPTPLAESQVAATSAAAPPPPASATKSDAERKEVATNQVGQIGGVAATQNQARNYQNLTPSGPSANQAQPERAPERAKREAPATVADAAAPPPAPKPQERAAEQDQKVDDKAATEARRDELAARKSANEEEGQSTARAKAVPRAPVGFVTSARSSRQVRNIGSKSFRLENGSWTDTEYDAGKGLPVIRLQHNSEEYRQTLKEIPGLNPYFNLKTVIVVWQGKVYRVEKK